MARSGAQDDPLSIWIGGLSLGGLVCAIAPLFVIPIPAMLDYVNHLSRMYLLSGAPSPAYAVRFRLCTDMMSDLAIPLLAHLMGVEAATKLFFGLSQILAVTGAMALEWTLKRRQRLGGPGALLVLFSLPFAWGMLNFMFGLGLAVWGVALWVRLKDAPPRLRWLVHATLVAALFITHFFDLGVYGLTIGLYELSMIDKRLDPGRLARLAGFMASPVLVGVAVMAMVGGGVGQSVFHWDSFGLKLTWPLVFMNVYDPRLALLTAAALGVILAVSVATRRLSLTRAGVWIAVGYGVIYLVLPRMMFGTQYQDVRMLTAAALVLPAFMAMRLDTVIWRAIPAAVIATIIVVNTASVARAWAFDQTDYAQFEQSFPRLARGSTVLTSVRDEADRRDVQPLFYAPTLAAPARGAFVYSLYSLRGMQPVEPRPAFQALLPRDSSEYKPPRLSVLLAADRGVAGPPPQLMGWTHSYRYLYLLGPLGPDPLPGRLRRLYTGRRFALYEIIPDGLALKSR